MPVSPNNLRSSSRRAVATRIVAALAWLSACADLEQPSAQRQLARAVPARDASSRQDAAGARPAFCDRADVAERATAIDTLLCAQSASPNITSLRELQNALELVPFARAAESGGYPPVNQVVMLAHSTALPGHMVSPINPRAIIIGQRNMLAYVRGAQEVELVSHAPDRPEQPVFYLLRYRQACNHSEQGCSFGDLYTPATESGWIDVDIRDDTELENTPFDCRACHARGGAEATLLMREVDGPWTHFFDTIPAGQGGSPTPELKGFDLAQDYRAAKGDELYAEIDVSRLAPSTAQALEINVGLKQPLYFDSLQIETERWPKSPDGYASEPQPSPTWEAGYAAFKRGEQLALPHYDPRPTSAEKQARLTEAYVRFRSNQLDLSALPDFADIFPDDPMTRAQIGLEVEPDATPVDALIQACAPCHNAVLNQELSRASFSVDLAHMSDAELDSAIARLELPRTAAGAMPPLQARALTPPVRERLIEYLRGDARSAEIDPKLGQAAELGMMGGRRARRP